MGAGFHSRQLDGTDGAVAVNVEHLQRRLKLLRERRKRDVSLFGSFFHVSVQGENLGELVEFQLAVAFIVDLLEERLKVGREDVDGERKRFFGFLHGGRDSCDRHLQHTRACGTEMEHAG